MDLRWIVGHSPSLFRTMDAVKKIHHGIANLITSDDSSENLVILVLGSTGQTGSLVVNELEKHSIITVRRTSRKQEQVDAWIAEGKDAVFLDMDDPRTFALAMHGVDRLFLMTGYTVAMSTHGKTLIDAAIKAGIRHVVKLSAYYEWDNIVPQWTWLQLTDTYLKNSGIAWTILHPNAFMENVNSLRGGQWSYHWGNARVGWIAIKDIAAVAAVALREGPKKHHGKAYWLSTEVLDGPQIGALLTEELGTPITINVRTEEDFLTALHAHKFMDEYYGECLSVFFREVRNGGMGYTGTVRDDVPFVTGRPATTFREWVKENKEKLMATMKG